MAARTVILQRLLRPRIHRPHSPQRLLLVPLAPFRPTVSFGQWKRQRERGFAVSQSGSGAPDGDEADAKVSKARNEGPGCDSPQAMAELQEDEKLLPRARPGLEHEEIPSKTPSESRTVVRYNFSSSHRLRESYRNPWDQVRMGKVLEDLDAMAGNIAMKHARMKKLWRPIIIVTAGVDRIKLQGRANINEDMILEGAVTWTGSSSMEIGMTLKSGSQLWLKANFTFVARDPDTGKAAKINPLEPSKAEEKILYNQAAKRQNIKKAKRSTRSEDVLKLRKTMENEMKRLLELGAPLKRMPALANKGSILMYKTQLSNALTCQPQTQNIHGRIFGGFLMRRAFELAFATAYLFSGGRPQFMEVDDVSFLKPVNIGDLLQLESVVLYTQPKGTLLADGKTKRPHPEIHVEVRAFVSDPSTLSSHTSNTFNFTFCVVDKEEVLNVYPGTEIEAERVVQMKITDMEQEQEDAELTI